MNFQSSCKIITNQSLRHYSHESLTSQLGPFTLSNLSAKSISFIPRPETEQFAGARDSGRRGDRQRRRRGPGASTCPAAPVGGPNSDEDCRWRADHVSQRWQFRAHLSMFRVLLLIKYSIIMDHQYNMCHSRRGKFRIK